MYKVGSVPTTFSSGTTPPPYPLPKDTAGNYYAVCTLTPVATQLIAPQPTSNPTPPQVVYGAGPWRVSIQVYRMRGTAILRTSGGTWDPLKRPTNVRGWDPSSAPPSVINAGGYILDTSPNRGEAYMLDAITYPNDPKTAVLFLGPGAMASATSMSNVNPATVKSQSTTPWILLPGVVGVYHTMIGD
jgi:hypothetical protein